MKTRTGTLLANSDLRAEVTGISGLPQSGLPVESGDLSLRDARTLKADREYIIAEDMPVRLMKPRMSNRTEQGDTVYEAVTWGIQAVGAHSSSYSGAGVRVAVLDTGIASSHPSFRGLKIVSHNFTTEADVEDKQGHGTHCAGTIAGQDISGQRIGVARGLEALLCCKVLLSDGSGTTESVIRALGWAEEASAHIISLSLGFDFAALIRRLRTRGYPEPAAISRALETYRSNLRLFEAVSDFLAARELIGRGALVVAAAGNESDRSGSPAYEVFATPPAALERHVSVGAVGPPSPNFELAPFSNAGADVAAPGIDVQSAGLGGGITILSGTSMAAPHVAGVAALWAEKFLSDSGRVRASELRSVLVGTARLPENLDAAQVGRGIVAAP